MEDNETMIRTGGAAALLGVSREAVLKACDDGRLPYWLMPGSRHRMLKRSDVLAFKDKGYVIVKARLQP